MESKIVQIRYAILAVLTTIALTLAVDAGLAFGQGGNPGTYLSYIGDDNKGASGGPYNQGLDNNTGNTYHFTYDAFVYFNCSTGPWPGCYVCDVGQINGTNGSNYQSTTNGVTTQGTCGNTNILISSTNTFSGLPSNTTFQVTNYLTPSRVQSNPCQQNEGTITYGSFIYQTPQPDPAQPGPMG